MTVNIRYEFEDDRIPPHEIAELEGRDDIFSVTHHETIGDAFLPVHDLVVSGSGAVKQVTQQTLEIGPIETTFDQARSLGMLMPGTEIRFEIGALVNKQIVQLTLVASRS